MTGALMAISDVGGSRYVVTVGEVSAGTTWGFSDTVAGSIAPDPPVLKGSEIDAAFARPGGASPLDFLFRIKSEETQDFISRVVVFDSTGTPFVFETASADSFTAAGGVSVWTWGDGTGAPWSGSDDGLDRRVEVF